MKRPDRDISNLIRDPSRLLFDAAALGNVEFFIILFRKYPDLIWKVEEGNRSLFHVAVVNRQESIFNLIYEIGAIKDLIAAYKDGDSNNMLHLAGNLAPSNRLEIVSGAALQLQRELLWFKVPIYHINISMHFIYHFLSLQSNVEGKENILAIIIFLAL